MRYLRRCNRSRELKPVQIIARATRTSVLAAERHQLTLAFANPAGNR